MAAAGRISRSTSGVVAIGESQLENIQRLKRGGVDGPFMLLRLPAPSEAEEVVATADISLNSELSVLGALSQAAQRRGRRHEVIVMVDLGDLREGLWPAELKDFIGAALGLPGIRIAGLGTNLACFRPALVGNVRRARTYRFTWRGAPGPAIEVEPEGPGASKTAGVQPAARRARRRASGSPP